MEVGLSLARVWTAVSPAGITHCTTQREKEKKKVKGVRMGVRWIEEWEVLTLKKKSCIIFLRNSTAAGNVIQDRKVPSRGRERGDVMCG